MYIVCCDLESVFIPELWVCVAKHAGIDELKLTTRDEPDYAKLMRMRLDILKENNLKLKDVQEIIARARPLEGAREFLDWLRSKTQVIILSDTFTQFAKPMMAQLNMPTLLCNRLITDEEGWISDFVLRQQDAKQKAVEAMQGLDYQVAAFGDSYNDIGMLKTADFGVFYRPPDKVLVDWPHIPVVKNFDELKKILKKVL